MKNLLIKVYNYFKSFFVKPLPKKKMGYYGVLEEGRIVMNDKAIVGIIVNEKLDAEGELFQPDFNTKKPFHKKY